jgi:myo-inositol-1(or 4)-monophosphatase
VTDTHDFAADLELAVRAAREAGEGVRAAFRSGLEVRFKGADQPVTEADLEADRTLHRALLGGRPEYGWLSEETADSPERLAKRRVWVVDPIDGTNSFVAGIAEFVIVIGLVDGHRAVLGVVFNPATDELYHAVLGGGAFRNGEPIRVAGTAEGAEVRTMLASRSEIGRGDFARYADGWRVEAMGSTAYRMVKVADGTGDASISRRPKHEWDLCGADVVLTEAGGRATGLDGERPRYNQPRPTVRGIVATNGRLHDAVLAMARADRG